MSNSIKNLIQQSKNEPSLQNEMNATESDNTAPLKSNRSNSVSSVIRKKSSGDNNSSPTHRGSPGSSPKSTTLYKLHENETKNSLNDIYVSPSGEIRSAAKRASIKIQQQNMQFAELLQNSNGNPPPVPTSPLPPAHSEGDLNEVNPNGI